MVFIKSFKDLGSKDVLEAGGKGASLGEMTRAGIPVPKGFVILSQAFENFIELTSLNVEITAVLDKVNHKEMHTVEAASEIIQGLIKQTKIPEDLQRDIFEAFDNLESEFVAVRSSATSEDSAKAAWAGQLDSFLNTNKATLIDNVRNCWASLFTPRAIFYRFDKELHQEHISVAVVVQKMIQSEKSGIVFSVHPVTQDPDQIIIEAGYGLGEAVVSGSITPDSYVISKSGNEIQDVSVNMQTKKLVRKENRNHWTELGTYGNNQVLSAKEIIELSKLVEKVELHYGFPVDVEWAYENNKFFIVQSRPITTIKDSRNDIYQEYTTVDWRYLVNRRESLLFRSITDNCYDKFESLTDIKWQPTKIIRFKSGEILHSAKELSELGKYFLTDSINRLIKFKQNLIHHVTELDVEAERISNMDLSKLSIQEIQTLVENYFKIASSAQNFLLPMPTADRVLSQIIKSKLKGIKNKDELLVSLTFPEKENSHVDEERSFYQLVNSYKKSKGDFKKLIEEHLKQFSWIGARGYNFNNEWTEEILVSRIKQFAESDRDPIVELQQLETARHQRIKEANKLFKDNKLKEVTDFSNIVELAKEYVYLRTWRADIIYRAGVKVKNLMNYIKHVLGISNNDLIHLSYLEIIDSLKSGKLTIKKEELEKRKNNFITLFWNGNYIILTEPAILAYLNQNILPRCEVTNEISGSAVYPGVVEGKTALVLQPEDIDKVQKGDILVTVMTFPHFIAAMEKASAFVTDEGGILCHAAIIAREMRKPCVIATKNATSIIKSKDRVQVDGNKGMVRILK